MVPPKFIRYAAVLSAASMLQGCLMYSGGRTPNLVETAPAPTLTAAPRIGVVMLHKRTTEAYVVAEHVTLGWTMEAFERVRDDTPYLKNAGVDLPRPDLVLELDTEVVEEGMSRVTGMSFFLIPGFSSTDIIINAKLNTPEGELLASYGARGKSRAIAHLLLLPLSFINLWTAPNQLYDDTFRDIFIQLESDVRKFTEAE